MRCGVCRFLFDVAHSVYIFVITVLFESVSSVYGIFCHFCQSLFGLLFNLMGKTHPIEDAWFPWVLKDEEDYLGPQKSCN